ncbi:hypothetical protein F4801DRAFT_271942 [Xylaria longipes]|nr:hypothetical protein F4801DRAFT_271942 [Xylaria longipes]
MRFVSLYRAHTVREPWHCKAIRQDDEERITNSCACHKKPPISVLRRQRFGSVANHGRWKSAPSVIDVRRNRLPTWLLAGMIVACVHQGQHVRCMGFTDINNRLISNEGFATLCHFGSRGIAAWVSRWPRDPGCRLLGSHRELSQEAVKLPEVFLSLIYTTLSWGSMIRALYKVLGLF